MTRSAPHYQGLDFLRGVAAFCVVMFHFSTRLDIAGLFSHGYLAVDFFFVLSGFVLDRAYNDRIASGTLSFNGFITARLVRLLPVVVFGTTLAALIDLFRPGHFSTSQHVLDIFITGLLGCFLLPTFWKTTLEDTTYPLNGPIWSLSLEITANFVHGLLLRTKYLRSAFFTVAVISLSLLFYNLKGDDINVGTHIDNFSLGFCRVFWSYSIGVLISNYHVRVPAVSKWLYASVLIVIFAVPTIPQPAAVIFDFIAVALLFPLIVLGASQCINSQMHSYSSQWSGDVSYPLYGIHYPLVRVISALGRYVSLPTPLNIIATMLITACLAQLASLVFNGYDVPVRKWLRRRLGRYQGVEPEVSARSI